MISRPVLYHSVMVIIGLIIIAALVGLGVALALHPMFAMGVGMIAMAAFLLVASHGVGTWIVNATWGKK